MGIPERWLLAAAVLTLPLSLDAVVGRLWVGDLYDMMLASRGERTWRPIALQLAPIWVPAVHCAAFLAIGMLGFRSWRARVRLCRACRRRDLAARALALAGLPLVAALGAAALYLWHEAPPLDERYWGLLFLPWAAVAAFWIRRASLPVRTRRLGQGRLELIGARALSSGVTPPTPAMKARMEPDLSIPAVVVIATLVFVSRRLETNPLTCTYGTYPLAYRYGVARVVGCKAPHGVRHGRWRGEPGSWNSSGRMAFEGAFWFGDPWGDFVFRDEAGRPRVQGRIGRRTPTGTWILRCEPDDVCAELDYRSPGRARVVRSPSQLACPGGAALEMTGAPWYGELACTRADGLREGPFLRVDDSMRFQIGTHVLTPEAP